MAARSRMNRKVHVRICEGLGVKFPGATRPVAPQYPRSFREGDESPRRESNRDRPAVAQSREQQQIRTRQEARQRWYRTLPAPSIRRYTQALRRVPPQNSLSNGRRARQNHGGLCSSTSPSRPISAIVSPNPTPTLKALRTVPGKKRP